MEALERQATEQALDPVTMAEERRHPSGQSAEFDRVGAVTGVVGAAGGLGGFFPPLVMAVVKAQTGTYTIGFVLMAVVAAIALLVLRAQSGGTARRAAEASSEVAGARG